MSKLPYWQRIGLEVQESALRRPGWLQHRDVELDVVEPVALEPGLARRGGNRRGAAHHPGPPELGHDVEVEGGLAALRTGGVHGVPEEVRIVAAVRKHPTVVPTDPGELRGLHRPGDVEVDVVERLSEDVAVNPCRACMHAPHPARAPIRRPNGQRPSRTSIPYLTPPALQSDGQTDRAPPGRAHLANNHPGSDGAA